MAVVIVLTLCAEKMMIKEDDLRKNRVVSDSKRKAHAKPRLASETHMVTETATSQPQPAATVQSSGASLSQAEIDNLIARAKLYTEKSPPVKKSAPGPKDHAKIKVEKPAILKPVPAPVSAPVLPLASAPVPDPTPTSAPSPSLSVDTVSIQTPPEPTPAAKSARKFDMNSIEDNPFANEHPNSVQPIEIPAVAKPVQKSEEKPNATVLPPAEPAPKPTPQSIQAPVPSTATIKSVPPPPPAPPAESNSAPSPAATATTPPTDPAEEKPAKESEIDVISKLAAEQVEKSAESIKNSETKQTELKTQISNLDEGTDNIRRMYLDGFISKSTYDETKKSIEDSIRRDKESISLEKEREVMETLKKKLDRDIVSSIKGADFSSEESEVESDLERARKLREYKVIDDATYEDLKSRIIRRMDHGRNLISEVNAVIDTNLSRYESSFSDTKKDPLKPATEVSESPEIKAVEPEKEAVPESGPPKSVRKKLKSKLSGIFSILNKNGQSEVVVDSSSSDLLDSVKNIESRRDAIIELCMILKSELQKKLEIEEELTYELLAKELAAARADETLKSELIDFLKKTTESEYTGTLDENQYDAIFARVREFMDRISSLHPGRHPIATATAAKPVR